MAFQPPKFQDRLMDRNAALKRRAEALQQAQAKAKESAKAPASPAPAPAATQMVAPAPAAPAAPKVAAVRMTGEPTLMLTADGRPERLCLVHALHQCVDLYLVAAQTRSRHCVLLWPGNLDSLPLIHAIATWERWTRGYKRGIRAALYPATQASFHGLNHVYVNRSEIALVNSMWQEVTAPYQMVPHEKCVDKDMLLFALASQYKDDTIHPCFNELLPHFLLEGDCKAKEIAQRNYGEHYLSHVITKLAKLKQKKLMRDGVCKALGPAATAPDAVFGLSYRMTKQQIIDALKALKTLAPLDVVLLDATRVAFDRVEKAQNRIATFLRCLHEVFGKDGPGALIVTNDPRQMTYVRAAIAREEVKHGQHYQVQGTVGLRVEQTGNGLCAKGGEPSVTLAPAAITVEITDKEAGKLLNQAFRLSQTPHLPTETITALNNAAQFLRMMANLPTAASLLQERLNEDLADPVQRTRYDWVHVQNALKKTLQGLASEEQRPFFDWLRGAGVLLQRQEDGTPLARAMAALAQRHAQAGEKVLVLVQSGFYQQLAHRYFFGSVAGTEELTERVQFASLAQREEKCKLYVPDRVIACVMAPKLLNSVITTPTLPYAIDFLLTQSAAQATFYALQPVLGFPAFQPYEQRVRAIFDRLAGAQGAAGAVLPELDYQTPAFTLTVPASGPPPTGDRGPSDYVKIEIEHGSPVYRGPQSKVYVYDPAATESRSLGFRGVAASDVRAGQHIFLMSEAMRDEAEAVFGAAGVVLDHAGRFEAMLRRYHDEVSAAVAEHFPGTVAHAARRIRDDMAQRNCAQEVGNVRYWINLKHAKGTAFQDLMPQAPRHHETFRVFMEVLGFDKTEIAAFWDGAVKRVRVTRIADGISIGDHYARALFDPEAAATYDRLPPDVLKRLRAGALDNIYEVTAVSFVTI